MAKFRFPMENVIKVRKVAEELAQRDLQMAQAYLNSEIELLENMKRQKTEAFQQRHAFESEGGTKVPHLTQVQDFLVGQDIRIDRQQRKIQEIETQVEALREILRQKAIELKMIERLKEKRLDEFRLEEKRKDVKRVDDLTMARFKVDQESE